MEGRIDSSKELGKRSSLFVVLILATLLLANFSCNQKESGKTVRKPEISLFKKDTDSSVLDSLQSEDLIQRIDLLIGSVFANIENTDTISSQQSIRDLFNLLSQNYSIFPDKKIEDELMRILVGYDASLQTSSGEMADFGSQEMEEILLFYKTCVGEAEKREWTVVGSKMYGKLLYYYKTYASSAGDFDEGLDIAEKNILYAEKSANPWYIAHAYKNKGYLAAKAYPLNTAGISLDAIIENFGYGLDHAKEIPIEEERYAATLEILNNEMGSLRDILLNPDAVVPFSLSGSGFEQHILLYEETLNSVMNEKNPDADWYWHFSLNVHNYTDMCILVGRVFKDKAYEERAAKMLEKAEVIFHTYIKTLFPSGVTQTYPELDAPLPVWKKFLASVQPSLGQDFEEEDGGGADEKAEEMSNLAINLVNQAYLALEEEDWESKAEEIERKFLLSIELVATANSFVSGIDTNTDARMGLGLLYKKLGNLDKSLYYFAKAGGGEQDMYTAYTAVSAVISIWDTYVMIPGVTDEQKAKKTIRCAQVLVKFSSAIPTDILSGEFIPSGDFKKMIDHLHRIEKDTSFSSNSPMLGIANLCKSIANLSQFVVSMDNLLRDANTAYVESKTNEANAAELKMLEAELAKAKVNTELKVQDTKRKWTWGIFAGTLIFGIPWLFREMMQNKKLKKALAEIKRQNLEIKEKNEELGSINVKLSELTTQLQVKNNELEDINNLNQKLISALSEYEQAINSTSSAIMLVSPEGNVKWTNKATDTIFGNGEIGSFKKKIANIIPEDGKISAIKDKRAEVLKTKKSVTFEVELPMQSGENKWFTTTMSPIFDENGDIISIVIIDTSIQLRKDAERELLSKNEELKLQTELLQIKNREITDSITYASRIQKALLPTNLENTLKTEYGLDCFVLNKPKDILSGDFPRFRSQNDGFFISAVDCTGHGIPGAFMSILGNESLYTVSNDKAEESPKRILTNLHKKVFKDLHNGKEVVEDDSLNDGIVENDPVKDGADMQLCFFKYNTEQGKWSMKYSGANNDLYIVKDCKLEVLKAKKKAIGETNSTKFGYAYEDDTEVFLNPGDVVYLFSDGFQDQMGDKSDLNPDGRKFKVLKFKKLLEDIHNFPVAEQKARLEKIFMERKGDLEQTDDVLLIGVKIPDTNIELI